MSRTVFITGTSSGIGRATALHFQAQGWQVVATMRSPQHETALGTLANVRVVRLDVTDEAGIAEAFAQAIDAFGTIDVLVNNAGFGAYGPLETMPAELIRRQFDTNVIGLYAVTKAIVPHMRERRGGTIVNVGSMGGVVAFPLGSLYHGSKFAVEGLSEALGYELGALGIRVKLVEPGMTRTDFGGRSLIFHHDASVPGYASTVENTVAGFASLARASAEASAVAQTIFTAATDGTARLRYVSGGDAARFIDLRRSRDDDALFAHMRETFGL